MSNGARTPDQIADSGQFGEVRRPDASCLRGDRAAVLHLALAVHIASTDRMFRCSGDDYLDRAIGVPLGTLLVLAGYFVDD
ncbi:hypothetical protein, partial [Kitasatospora sp. NPDC057223]|uniref:hypothetical protein n=1 Tax=Kitasatospora sp. NPDC057223 TaxID=3346055 RepID=UPI00363969BC